jgi:Ankyrin repeat
MTKDAPSREDDLLRAFETHSVTDIQTLLDAGLDPRQRIRGKLAVDSLIEKYTRSDRFPACLRLLLERGAMIGDQRVQAVLLDDGPALEKAIDADPSVLSHRTTMVSTFTPLTGASLLHVAAEYGNANVARVLIARGADVDARADVDDNNLNGHTPIFHTVNSNGNRSAGIMEMLLDAGASSTILLRGITWGAGFEWETTLFDVNPVSYAQFGLLPQMHRDERQIYANISRLLNAPRRSAPAMNNVPNRYLEPR